MSTVDRRRLLPVWLLLAILATGCATLPTSGDVVQGRPAGDSETQPDVAVIAAPPRPGDDPAAVVEGFISAMASFEPGYRTARQFLTAEASQSWVPADGVAVYDLSAGPRTVQSEPGLVRTELPLQARVGPDGHYRRASQDARLRLDLRMELIQGEWRIDTPPDGLVMSTFDFEREFAAQDIYFFDPSFGVLTPDPTYLPVRGNTPTLMVQSLLDGPSEWFAPAVRSAVPEGTTLVGPEIVVDAGTARVNLAGPISELSDVELDRLAAQLAWTLGQVPGVTTIALLEHGVPVPVSGSESDTFATNAYPVYNPAFVPTGDAVYALGPQGAIVADQERVEPVPGSFGDGVTVRSLAVDRLGTAGVGVTLDGTLLLRAPFTEGAEAVVVTAGTDLAQPSWDRNDTVWVADRKQSGSTLLALESDGTETVVDAARFAGERVQQMRVSPDGVRVAVLVGPPAEAEVVLGLVLREPGENPRLGRWQTLPLGLEEIRDITWSGVTGLVVLASPDEEQALQPYQVDLAEVDPVSRGEISRAVSIAAAPGQPLVVATDANELLRQDVPLEWSPITAGRAPTYPG